MDRRELRIKGDSVVLRSKRIEDVDADYRWRIDPELAALDATRPVTLSFNEYSRYHDDDLRFPSPWSVRFAIEAEDGRHIGNCMYYDINLDLQQAELGIMIGDRAYWDSGFGTDAVTTLVGHGFMNTALTRIYLHTLVHNLRAQRAFEKAGFAATERITRDGYEFQRMEIRRPMWKARDLASEDTAGAARQDRDENANSRKSVAE